MTKEPKRGFTGFWIPAEIINMQGLTWQQRLIWCEIKSLHDEAEGGCWASNEYLGKVFDCSGNKIANDISVLRKLGLVETVCFDGRKRVIVALLPDLIKSDSLESLRQTSQNREPCIHEIVNQYTKRDTKGDYFRLDGDPCSEEQGNLPEASPVVKPKEKDGRYEAIMSSVKQIHKDVTGNEMIIPKSFYSGLHIFLKDFKGSADEYLEIWSECLVFGARKFANFTKRACDPAFLCRNWNQVLPEVEQFRKECTQKKKPIFTASI